MAHSYHQHLYHLVWSTKDREPLILPEFKQRLFEYLLGSFRTAGCTTTEVGGMPDHVHLLVGIPPKFAVSEIIRDVKICSNKWVNANFADCRSPFSWQEGFGSFTVSPTQKNGVIPYIANQEKHHKVMSFKEEFTKFLDMSGIQYDEKYLWV